MALGLRELPPVTQDLGLGYSTHMMAHNLCNSVPGDRLPSSDLYGLLNAHDKHTHTHK